MPGTLAGATDVFVPVTGAAAEAVDVLAATSAHAEADGTLAVTGAANALRRRAPLGRA